MSTAGSAQATGVAAGSGPRLFAASAGAGPPLVLLHGFALHGGVFDDTVARLARAHRVHVVDLPGHGHSTGIEATSLDAVADLVARTVGDLTTGAPTDRGVSVLGWSFGGLVAMAWALRRPADIARLALVCTTPSFVTRPGWPCAMEAATLLRFGDELRVAWRLTLQRFLTLQVQGSDEGRRTLAQLRTRLFARGQPSAEQLAATLAILVETDLRARVHAIRAPTLVVAGPRDTLAPPDAAAWLARTLPDARHLAVEGAAHAPFLSHPVAFERAVTDFLDGR